jgi:hypothetical protein
LRDLSTPLRIKLRRSGDSSFEASLSASLHGTDIFLVVDPILNLPGSDIDDQFSELDRVARAL